MSTLGEISLIVNNFMTANEIAAKLTNKTCCVLTVHQERPRDDAAIDTRIETHCSSLRVFTEPSLLWAGMDSSFLHESGWSARLPTLRPAQALEIEAASCHVPGILRQSQCSSRRVECGWLSSWLARAIEMCQVTAGTGLEEKSSYVENLKEQECSAKYSRL